MEPALRNYPLTIGTQRQPEEQAESYQRPSASSSSVPSASRPVVAPALSVQHHAPGYSDRHVSPPATVSEQSLPYPVPVSQSAGDESLLQVPGSAAPISASPSHAGQNNPSTDAESETTQADSTPVSVPANTGGLNGQDITDHGTTSNTRTSIPVDSALRSQLTADGRFLDPEKYDPVKLLGSGGFAKVIYHLLITLCEICCLVNPIPCWGFNKIQLRVRDMEVSPWILASLRPNDLSALIVQVSVLWHCS